MTCYAIQGEWVLLATRQGVAAPSVVHSCTACYTEDKSSAVELFLGHYPSVPVEIITSLLAGVVPWLADGENVRFIW